MRKLPFITTVLITLLFSFAAHGFEISVSEFQGEYVKPEGNASAVSDGMTIEFHLLVNEDELVLSVGEDEIAIENPPAALLNIDALKWDGISLDLAESTYDLGIGSFDATMGTTDAQLRTAALHCDAVESELGFVDKLLDSCLTDGTLDVERATIWSEPKEEEFREVFYELFQKSATISEDAEERTKTEFKNIDLDIVDHKFKLSTKADMGIKATLKMEGRIEFNSEARRIELRLDKAKASFFNIKEKIFELVEGMESDAIVVERPYIYLTMGTSEVEQFIDELR